MKKIKAVLTADATYLEVTEQFFKECQDALTPWAQGSYNLCIPSAEFKNVFPEFQDLELSEDIIIYI